MFLLRLSLASCIALLAQGQTWAADKAPPQKNGSAQAIEDTVRQFFTSMSKRDVRGLQAVLDTRLMAIEASGNQGRIRVIDPADPNGLLPPEGNDDFDTLKIATVKAESSKTHPTVAMASFMLVLPLDATALAHYQNALKEHPDKLTDAQKDAMAQIVEDRAHRIHMFAMLVRQHGSWKIACMTFPK